MDIATGEFPDFFDIISWKVIVVIVIVCILRSWLKGFQYKGRESGKGLVVVITGGNCGIGKQIVKELNIRGAKVHIILRNKERVQETLIVYAQLGINVQRIVPHVADLTSFEAVRNAANEIISAESKVDVLINNAGIMLYPKFQLTKDGHELTWQTNYLGHFLLTELLLPLLEAAPEGRIVNVSAVAYNYSDGIDLATVDRRESWDPRNSYARSKLAQVMHALELSRRLRERGSAVTINACQPGICLTRIARHTPVATYAILKYTITPIAWFFMKTPKDGAQTPLLLSLCKEFGGISGKYYSECSEKEPSDLAKDKESCRALYEYSRQICGLESLEEVEPSSA